MTEEFWRSLSDEQRRAYVSALCVRADGKLRVAGGIYCDHHTALLQAGYRRGED
jgi:hypothetical protein